VPIELLPELREKRRREPAFADFQRRVERLAEAAQVGTLGASERSFIHAGERVSEKPARAKPAGRRQRMRNLEQETHRLTLGTDVE
jgi:hypothetical protein